LLIIKNFFRFLQNINNKRKIFQIMSAQEECAICQLKFASKDIEKHVSECFEKQSQMIQKKSPALKSNKRESVLEKSYDIFNRSKRVKVDIKSSGIITHECGESSKPRENEKLNLEIPLAEKMRPENFETYCGQENVIGKDSLIRKLIDSNKITSTIFYGPPGC
jgi:hypothetical protein